MIILPSGGRVSRYTPVYPGSNFTWGEVTKNGTRAIRSLYIQRKLVVSDAVIEGKIIATAQRLDLIRSKLGDQPIYINSWYRPAHVNHRVGGSLWSRHQYGDGVDIRSNKLSPREIYQQIEPYHDAGGISCYDTFVHIDWRGHKARW